MKYLIGLLLLILGPQKASADPTFYQLTGGMLSVEEAKSAIDDSLRVLNQPMKIQELKVPWIQFLGEMKIDLRTMKTGDSTEWLMKVSYALADIAENGKTKSVKEEAMKALIKFTRTYSNQY
ncbi:MAG: hypothetical protein ABL958_19655 [Bdellovibrionia bacterium]